MKNNPKYIFVHCTDAGERDIFDQLKSVNEWHKARDFNLSTLGYYVGYHRLITGGKNYQTRDDLEIGCHCNQNLDDVSFNFISLAVCVGFDGDIEFPNQTHYDLLRAQVLSWQKQYNIPDANVVMHRTFTPWKTCPGSKITQEWISTLIKKEVVVKPPSQVENQEQLINIQEQLGLIARVIMLLQQIKQLYNNNFKNYG